MKLAFRTDIASVDVSSNLRNKPELSVKENHCIAEDNFFSYGEGLKQPITLAVTQHGLVVNVSGPQVRHGSSAVV